jgi:hypothetical protein
MGIAFRHDERTGVSISVWDGDVSPEQRETYVRGLGAEGRWGAGGLILTDLRTLTPTSIPSAEQIVQFAASFLQTLGQRVRKAKWAVVADHAFYPAQDFGDQLQGTVPGIVVFNGLENACIWLGVNAADIQALIDELRAEIAGTTD